MLFHSSTDLPAGRDVASVWLVNAIIVFLALGFAEFNVAMIRFHRAVHALHVQLVVNCTQMRSTPPHTHASISVTCAEPAPPTNLPTAGW